MNYRSRYPQNWQEISREIRFSRAHGQCEWCGAVAGEAHPVTGSYVVLSVAHLGMPRADGTPGDNHDKADCRPENLAALCQRCHLNFDRDDHMRRARQTRLLKHLRTWHARGYTQLSLPTAEIAVDR